MASTDESEAHGVRPPNPDHPDKSGESGTPRQQRKKRSFWFELPILVLVAVLVAVVMRTFVIQTFYIPSGSMEQTLQIDDRVLVNKVVYRFRDPHRGEIVVFQPPKSWRIDRPKEDFIKRVIGVGGDHVVCCDAQDRLLINNKPLRENYIYPGNKPSNDRFDIRVPKGRLFVMGDHRASSADSRAHLAVSNGTIPIDSVVGRAFAIFWPIGRRDLL